MAVTGFDWDDANVEHIACHGFEPNQVEEVFENPHRIRRSRARRYIAYGETFAGRLAFVVFERQEHGRIRVVTARDMNDTERPSIAASDMPRMPEAKLPLPKFASEEEEAQYWETHSSAAIWDQLPPARPVRLSPTLSKTIRERYLRRKQAATALLDPDQLAAAKRIAKRKSIAYETQIRLWIAEGIRRDSRARR